MQLAHRRDPRPRHESGLTRRASTGARRCSRDGGRAVDYGARHGCCCATSRAAARDASTGYAAGVVARGRPGRSSSGMVQLVGSVGGDDAPPAAGRDQPAPARRRDAAGRADVRPRGRARDLTSQASKAAVLAPPTGECRRRRGQRAAGGREGRGRRPHRDPARPAGHPAGVHLRGLQRHGRGQGRHRGGPRSGRPRTAPAAVPESDVVVRSAQPTSVIVTWSGRALGRRLHRRARLGAARLLRRVRRRGSGPSPTERAVRGHPPVGALRDPRRPAPAASARLGRRDGSRPGDHRSRKPKPAPKPSASPSP